MIQPATLVLVILAIVSANAFTPDQVKFQQDTLTAHNQYRTKHCASPLQLDDGLNQVAQTYAEHLAAQNIFEHSTDNPYGENLYTYRSSVPLRIFFGNQAVQSWYNEIQVYDFNKPGFSEEVGHFTQLVWQNSKKLGVGIAFNNNNGTVFVVTNYDPPGNYDNQFSKQVSAAKC